MSKFAFSAPETKQELFDIVAANADMEVAFLAGGTDLVPMINMEREEIPYEEKKPMMIVSLDKLGLSGICEANGRIEIGAMTTIEMIQDSELIRSKAPGLAEAADALAGFAIRNTATIGGNIMNASPAADTVPPLMAMGACVVTESADGEEAMLLADFMTGPKKTAIKPGAILTKIIIEPGKGGCGFVKIGRRAAETLSVVNAAAYVETEDGVCTKACVVVGSCAPTAVVCKEASESLIGKKINPAAAANMEDFYADGGVPQVMKELAPILHTDGMTVDGVTLEEVIEQLPERRRIENPLIRTMGDPYSVGKGIAIVKGNLAPLGGVTKPAAIAPEQLVFSGKAKVYDSEDDAIVDILGGKIEAGDLLVIRYEGPKGGPGMREMCNAMKYLHGLGLGTSTAIITDGRFSGTNNGCFVGHISPEAAEGGPIAAVMTGDEITLNIPENTITLHVSDEEIAERLAAVQPPAPRFTSGYLAEYSRHASSASEGAIIK